MLGVHCRAAARQASSRESRPLKALAAAFARESRSPPHHCRHRSNSSAAVVCSAPSEQLKKIAEQEEERRTKAKEQEEQRATELDARPASELDHSEQPPATHRQTEHPACRVPALEGDTPTAARRALAKAHCRLGAVHQPAHHHGTLRVSAQSAPAGEHLAGGARVVLTLGAKRASRRGKEPR